MTKPRWTPGPWQIDFDNVRYGGMRDWQVRSEHDSICNNLCYTENSEANAHLIAAAAELAEALEAVLFDIAEYERINNLYPDAGKQDCWQSVTRARAALRKAGGEQ